MKCPRSGFERAALVSTFGLLFSMALGAQSAPVPARITRPVNNQDLVTLRGNVHPLARPQNDRGPASDSLPIQRALLVLQRSPEQQAALDQLLVEQQVKSSPNYHRWLMPEEFGQNFGPSDSDVQAVTDWLTSQGLQVAQVSKGRTMIEFSGTAGLVRAAFHTQIHEYLVNGKTRWANSSEPEIPAALAPVVAGIDSLNSFPRRPQSRLLGTFRRSKATGEVRPLFTFTTANNVMRFAVGPGDFATIYNVAPLYTQSIDGTGQTIAVVADSNVNCQDLADFRIMFVLPYTPQSATNPCPSNVDIILNGPDPGILSGKTGDEGEADLDVQWAGAIAKNSTVKFVVSEDSFTLGAFGVDLSALYIVDNNLAGVMSDSFGACEAFLGTSGNAFLNATWEQAAAEGITVVVASGDSGSAGCDDPNTETSAKFGLGVSGVASTPFNLAVGGTDFDDAGSQLTYWNTTNNPADQSSAKSYIPELTWNDSCARSGSLTQCTSVSSGGRDLVAGSGGPSSCTTSTMTSTSITCSGNYPKPSWQVGAGGTEVAGDGARDIPDVSLFSSDGLNGSFYIFCQTDANTTNTTSCDLNSPFQDFQGGGGTSFAAPIFASIMALVNQKTGQRQGNPNFVLYKLAAQTGASCPSNAAMAATANASACIFYDTVKGNISVACTHGTPNCSNQTTSGFGILVDPQNTSSPAWLTTTVTATSPAGYYDRATGLGTVNVANLVNNWSSVTFSPTATTLTLTPPMGATLTTLAHGQSVTANISVSPTSGSGTPTGDVALIAQANSNPSLSTQNVGKFTLTSGAVSGSTTLLPGGSYNVIAHYAGDGTFSASDSSPVAVKVSMESSLTKIGLVTFDFSTGNITSLNATTAPYGSPDILRVDVTNMAGNPCSTTTPAIPCPTGQVTVTDNGNPLQDFDMSNVTTLNNEGFLEDQPVQFPAGMHSLVAAYAGDNSYMPSTSPADAITITQAVTSMTVSASPSTVAVGANVTLTAVVSTQSNAAAPTGTVTFFNNGSSIGTGSTTGTAGPTCSPMGGCAQLQATLTTSFPSAGTASITAQYSGDSNYQGSTTPTAATVNVTSTSGDFSLSAAPSSVTIASAGLSGTSTITVTPSNSFTGAVNFTCAVPAAAKEASCSLNPTSVTISGTANGTTALTVKTTGPHTVAGFVHGPDGFLPAARRLTGLLLLLLLAMSDPRRRRKLAYGLLFAGLLAALSIHCGGGGSNTPITDPGTPAGTYTVTVTGTAPTANLTHTASVTVTVQ